LAISTRKAVTSTLTLARRDRYDTDHAVAAQSRASQLNWVCNIFVGLGFPMLQARRTRANISFFTFFSRSAQFSFRFNVASSSVYV
jgi:hypothetical protein